MKEQHFPYLDKEREWFGLEQIDIAIIVALSVITGFLLSIFITPLVGLPVGFLILAMLFFFFLKLKRGKARGWIVRQIYHIFRLWNVIY
jgi:hypothetical protein